MGWWNASRAGESMAPADTGLVWSDEAADLLDDCLVAIAREFEEAMHRSPTNAELRAGLEFSLRGGDDNDDYTDHLAT